MLYAINSMHNFSGSLWIIRHWGWAWDEYDSKFGNEAVPRKFWRLFFIALNEKIKIFLKLKIKRVRWTGKLNLIKFKFKFFTLN